MSETATTITIKEVYERLVALEAKFDSTVERSRGNTRMFLRFVGILAALAIVNIFISVIILAAHLKGIK